MTTVELLILACAILGILVVLLAVQNHELRTYIIKREAFIAELHELLEQRRPGSILLRAFERKNGGAL